MTYIFKGDRPSNGAINLKEALGATLLRSTGSTYTGRRAGAVINWGCINSEAFRLSRVAEAAGRPFLNHPAYVGLVVNKGLFFNKMREELPQFTIPFVDNFDDAYDLVDLGSRMYARTILNSHSGKGIVLMVNAQDAEREAIQRVVNGGSMPVYRPGDNLHRSLRNCELFTQGVAGKRTEYRIHVVYGRVILVQQKRRKEDWGNNPNYNSLVRNVESSWIYAVNDVDQLGLELVKEAATQAVVTFGLDFGAVDVIYKHQTDQAFVLEINTAPGLDQDGSALTAYTEAFQNV